MIVRREAVRNHYAGGIIAFIAEVPIRSPCFDKHLFRVGFMCPEDTETYVQLLAARGLVYLHDGAARDVVVADQQSGLCAPCEWAVCNRMHIGEPVIGTVTVCRHKGSTDDVVSCPKGWEFEGSLSQEFGFAPLASRTSSSTAWGTWTAWTSTTFLRTAASVTRADRLGPGVAGSRRGVLPETGPALLPASREHRARLPWHPAGSYGFRLLGEPTNMAPVAGG